MIRGFLKIIVVFGIVCAIAGLFFYFFGFFGTVMYAPIPSNASTTTIPAVVVSAPLRQAPSGHKEYHSDAYRFSVLYPDDLLVSDHDNGQGGATVTFEDDKALMGFQIFITPFAGAQITDAQFKEDIPSGVRTNLTNIQVDGAVGAAFYSTDHLLGATREVWFTHGGYLYEVTTFKELDTWLDSILQTWKFTDTQTLQ